MNAVPRECEGRITTARLFKMAQTGETHGSTTHLLLLPSPNLHLQHGLQTNADLVEPPWLTMHQPVLTEEDRQRKRPLM